MNTNPRPLPATQAAADLNLTVIGEKDQQYCVAKSEDFDRHGDAWNDGSNWAVQVPTTTSSPGFEG